MRVAAQGAMGGPCKELFGKSAEDVVGDVIADLMTGGLPETANLRSYLTAAVRNRVRDLHRRSKHRTPGGEDFDEIAGHYEHEPPIEREELANQALAGLDSLPHREQFAIVERVMKRRKAQDVGADLGVTGQRVSQLVNAGLARLRHLPAFTELLSIDHSESTRSAVTGPDKTGSSE